MRISYPFPSAIAVLLTIWLAPANAEVDVNSGNYMLPHCEHYLQERRPYDPFDGSCGGVISAFMFVGSSLNEKYKFCPPKGAPNIQAARVFVKYMKVHPELLHLNFQQLALSALREGWPCNN